MMRLAILAYCCVLATGCDRFRSPAPEPEDKPPPVSDPIAPPKGGETPEDDAAPGDGSASARLAAPLS